MEKINCPVCGIGKIDAPKFDPEKKDELAIKRKAANTLRAANFSIREIMRLLGYKSPLSVQLLLKNGAEPQPENKG